jgi:hypothetical protein
MATSTRNTLATTSITRHPVIGAHTLMPRGVLGQGKSLGGLARGNRIVILSWLTFLGSEQTRRGELHVLGSRELNSR